jgi:hypothetical protein
MPPGNRRGNDDKLLPRHPEIAGEVNDDGMKPRHPETTSSAYILGIAPCNPLDLQASCSHYILGIAPCNPLDSYAGPSCLCGSGSGATARYSVTLCTRKHAPAATTSSLLHLSRPSLKSVWPEPDLVTGQMTGGRPSQTSASLAKALNQMGGSYQGFS